MTGLTKYPRLQTLFTEDSGFLQKPYELLGQMGDRLLCRGEGYYITRSEEEIQIFLYNYSHYDLLYRRENVEVKDGILGIKASLNP